VPKSWEVDCPFRFLRDGDGEIKRRRVAATEGTLKSKPLDYPAIVTDLPIRIVDTLHLVCKVDWGDQREAAEMRCLRCQHPTHKGSNTGYQVLLVTDLEG
jgi:hypothetical protein